MVEYGMRQSSTDPCVFRIVVDGKVELVITIHAGGIEIAGTHETCRAFRARLVTKKNTKLVN